MSVCPPSPSMVTFFEKRSLKIVTVLAELFRRSWKYSWVRSVVLWSCSSESKPSFEV